MLAVESSIGPRSHAVSMDHGNSHRVVPDPGASVRKVADIPLPGKAVRFDYQSLDTLNGRLYIAHMNADQLVVFDTRKRKVVANLDGVPSVPATTTDTLVACSKTVSRRLL